MKIIFTHDAQGHVVEYIHHLYEYCLYNPTESYVFLVPSEFLEVQKNLEWTECEHIKFDYIDSELSKRIMTSGLLRKSWIICRLLKEKSKLYNATSIFSIYMIVLVPFAPLFLSPRLSLSGIIYMIYLHRLKGSTMLYKLTNILKYLILSRSRVFDKVYILNDFQSAKKLNQMFRTEKFMYLPDPHIPLDAKNLTSIRDEYKIDSFKKVFVHFGSLNVNKGTLDLLKSLCELPKEIAIQSVFIIAGKVDVKIKDEYENLKKQVPSYVTVIYKESFCTFEYLASLCNECDAIVIPYKRTSQSSGVIGYASQFNKPVIAPNDGLLGQLIEKYNLGILIDEVSSINLINAYRQIINGEYINPDNQYVNDNSVENFNKTIFRCN